MGANKKATRNLPAVIQNKKAKSKKVMKKKASIPEIHVTPIIVEPWDDEELEQDSEQSIVTISHIECTVVVIEKWSNG